MTTPLSNDLQRALRRVVLGYRVVSVVWLGLLAVVAVALGPVRLSTTVSILAVTVGWTALTFMAARRPRVWSSWVWLGADALVAAAVLLAPLSDGPPAGGYPFSAVVVGVHARGAAGALVAALILAASTAARVGAMTGELSVLAALEAGLFWIAGGLLLAWGVGVLLRTEERRREAEAALAEERAERARSQERAETAAHLHDSVLQTLALIQRRAQDGPEVASLARRQERELRAWLRDGTEPGTPAASFERALTRVAAEIEQAHDVRVQVVTVGEAAVDERSEALVAAAKEALVNAAVHADVEEVSLYAEVVADTARVFVRDRGRGFDPAAVPSDRRGLSESITGRLRRRGGTARVRAAPGRGTEWELELPLSSTESVEP